MINNVTGTTVEEFGNSRNSLEVTKSLSDKHLDLLRPSARYYSLFKGQAPDAAGKGKYTLIKDEEDFQTGVFDKPLPCFGCGIGWFSFLVGFLCPLMWYYATFIYFGNHYRKDPRERAGLAASAIAAMACSVESNALATMEKQESTAEHRCKDNRFEKCSVHRNYTSAFD
ncbi:protein phosphatase 2C 7-like [Hibiscus syriacus]|uniref:Protein phosphatase 2C 7-like n=1 Tax=Hibiscus syriacus TaxID=106335 RepID=A0A6A2WY74_HIBSY|nr:protein phosphatase 2C 7-like [Hibiscus syriacus]